MQYAVRIVTGLLCFVSIWGTLGCAGSHSSAGASVAPAPDARVYRAFGMTVERPAGWQFETVNTEAKNETIIALAGPPAADGSPRVEIARRALAPEDRWSTPESLLKAVVTEHMQRYENFERLEANQETDVAGYPAAALRVRFREEQLDGTSQERAGTLYIVVHEKQIWFVRCLAGRSDVADAACAQILKGIHLDAP